MQYIINLRQSQLPQINEAHELALFELIRCLLAHPEFEGDVKFWDSLVQETNLLSTIASVVRRADGTDEFTHHLKAKIMNICCNLAMGSEDTVQELLEPKYGVMDLADRML